MAAFQGSVLKLNLQDQKRSNPSTLLCGTEPVNSSQYEQLLSTMITLCFLPFKNDSIHLTRMLFIDTIPLKLLNKFRMRNFIKCHAKV